MLNIEDRTHEPDIAELSALIGCDAFDALHRHMEQEYGARICIEYSSDKVLLGWNVKYRKAGRTLCTVYPRSGHFPLLLVVGQKEKERVEALLPQLSASFQSVYARTQEGMGQRWMLFDLTDPAPVLEDILQVVRIRRESR